MRVRLGTLREFLFEAVSMTRTTSRSAPTDPDAAVPGHLPNELPGSAALDDENGNPPQPGEVDEEAMVPGRWYGGEEPVGADRERLGDENGMDETDDHTVGDGLGNGEKDPNEPDYDYQIADHLRGDDEKTSLGNPPDETMEEGLAREIRSYLLQEEPAVAPGVDPTDVHGLYTPYDAVKDHTGTDDLSQSWYRSPGREPGADGDPFRGPDPHAQLGFHPPAAQADPTTTPPATVGMDGVAARRAPQIWQLNGGENGDNTSKMLGAGAKDPAAGVEAEDGSEEEGEETPGEADDEEGSEGQEQG